MVVGVVGVHVGGHHTLIALEVLRKLQADFMGGFKIQWIVRGEGLDDVVVAPAVSFMELLFHRFELITRSLRYTVHTSDEGVGGLFPVGHIVQDAA